MLKIIYCVAGAALIALNLGPFLELLELRRETVRLERRLEEMAVENSLLRDKIGRLESDPLEIERTARRELGLVREGEWVIRER